ncbi:transcriptional regulator Myc-like [Lampris incognitus]|uniref:transcriptional regulator Myc-like n=1 Tax=Lampris incognitus TaxID=2546036 RepID=UPI0024B550BB|nr:transcriptional regulator Myc-like [Lampris incognitus]
MGKGNVNVCYFCCSNLISEEEEGDEEEEDEEIDVVTGKKRESVKQCSSISVETRCPSLLVLKRCQVYHHYNYAAHPSTRWELPAVKMLKLESVGSHSRVFEQISSNRKCSNPQTSDTEDYNKRMTRTVHEGWRWNDRKSILCALQDEMPEVANDEKAAQVVILEKARECIHSMQSDEQSILSLKEQLRRKSELLRQRLAQLQSSRV